MPSYNPISSLGWTVVIKLLIVLYLTVAFWGHPAHAQVVDFTLADAAGAEHRLSDYRGKWLVINFWATWCAPCLREIPELIQFHDQHKNNDTIVIGIDFEEIDVASLRAFIKEQAMNYLVLRAGPTPLTAFEPLLGLPSTFLVSPQGVIVDKHVGPITLAQLEEFVAKNKNAANASLQTFGRTETYLGVAAFAVILLTSGIYIYRRMTAKHRQRLYK